MYELVASPESKITSVQRYMDAACIPLVQGNQDCRRFLKEWRDGAEVRDADGEPLPYSEQAVRDLGLEPRDLADTLAGQPAEVAA